MRRLLLAVLVLALAPATAHADLSPMPADITTGNDPGKGTAVVSYLPPTASTFGGAVLPPVTCTPPSGSAFPTGVTTITCSAQVAVTCIAFGVPAPQCSGAGGQVITDKGTSTVTIHDVEGPTLDPVSLFLPTPPGQTAAVAHYILNAADNVGVTLTNCTTPDGAAFPVGVTAVTCTVYDGAGHASQPKSFTITVTATPAPPAQQPAAQQQQQQGQPSCTVPKLRGKKLAAAKRALKNAHCAAGTVAKRHSSRKNKGKVLAQGRKAGKQLPAGSKVNLTVGR